MSPKKFLAAAAIFAATGLFCSPSITRAQDAPPVAHVPGELLIAPQDGVSDAEVEQIYKQHGGKKVKKLATMKTHRIQVAPQSLDAIESALRKNSKIKYVEKNFIGHTQLLPNDPGYPSQWHLPKISAPAGWDLTSGSASVVIAIVDSGVDPLHPDLVQVPGYNFLNNNTDTHDVLGHGTSVAGAASALGNSGIGISGVTWVNPVMSLVVVTSSNTGTVADAAEATAYAADHGAKVVNMSIGWTGFSQTLQDAVNYAWNRGLVIVAAAGNYNTSAPLYPAAMANVLAASATDSSDNRASWSNYGNYVDVAAPGVSIYTTANGGGYKFASGTSFSSPITAGLAALIFSLNPSLSNAQVVDLIKNNADDRGAAGFDPYFGWGRINVSRALQAAATLPALSVAVTNPAPGSTVSGTVPVTITVDSDAGVLKVELYVDGVLKGTDTSAPHSFSWNTSGLSGSHSLVAKAYDVAGNVADSDPVTVSVAAGDITPPSVSITGVVFSGKFMTVTVSASDPNGQVVKVELYTDGVLMAIDTSIPWSFKINVRSWTKGSSHALTAKAYDSGGNVGTSSQVTVVRP